MLMDGEDVMMISVEETPGTSSDEPHETSVSPRRSSDLHRSEDEFGMDQPSTSELKLTMQPTRYPDAYLQEILLSSPAHLFSCGLLPPEHLTASWEQWLCYLASSLTPHQWQFEKENVHVFPFNLTHKIGWRRRRFHLNLLKRLHGSVAARWLAASASAKSAALQKSESLSC